MTSPNFLLCLIGLLLGPMAETTALKPTSSLLHESREAGQKLTLQCLNDDESVTHVTWFKHAVGEKLQLISSVYKYTTNDSLQGEFRKNPRFSLDAQKGKNHLTISDLQVSDSATYYCLSCRYCMMDIVETVHVHVKSSSLSIPAVIHQSGPESIQPGGSVTLNCSVHTGSCDGEHRVYWFKDSEESQPGAIYTSGGRNDECERKAESQTHTCTYKLPLKKLDVSHAGTYHCAVVSCGHIVFGDGTRLDFKDQGIYPGFLVYFLSGGWAFTTILALILVCKKDKGSCKCATESQNSRTSFTTTAEDYKTYSSLTRRDDTWSECVYFIVRP